MLTFAVFVMARTRLVACPWHTPPVIIMAVMSTMEKGKVRRELEGVFMPVIPSLSAPDVKVK
jgi:hypothetical protein